jgi:hypothetical protein
MNRLIIEPSFKTPAIDFDGETGILSIRGRVFPENPFQYFSPLTAWLTDYSSLPSKETILIFSLSYFNSTANEYLFRCAKMIESLVSQGHNGKIVWEFESDDDDMKQIGEDFKELLKIKFDLKAIN